MPIEIRELNIRTTVTDNPTVTNNAANNNNSANKNTEKIVEECVQKVLRILNQKKEK